MSKEINLKKYIHWVQVFLHFPLTRIIIALVIVAGAVQGLQAIVNLAGQYYFNSDNLPKLWLIVTWVLSTLITFLAYYIYVRFIEKRSLIELACLGFLPELGLGSAVGAGMIVVVIAILWGLGHYQVIAINGVAFIIIPFFHYAYTAVYEEIIFRGILFRLIEKSLGSWIALIISGLLFGFAHSTVLGATLYSNLVIALLGGVIFSAAYMYTRRLWFTIGIHFAWNFLLVGMFGLELSEKDGKGFIESTISKSELITGGDMGIETSIITFIVVLSTGSYLLWKANKKGHFIRPFWIIKKQNK